MGGGYVVAVDSGIVHVAAALGVQAFCLTGAWDLHRFYPYVQEEIDDAISEPICIYGNGVDMENMSCAGCCSNAAFGFGNKECKLQCSAGETNQCLLRIVPEHVLEVINNAGLL